MYLESFDKNMRRVGILINATEIQRRRRLNSDYELSFLLPLGSDDFRDKVILKGHVKDERGQYYVINTRQRDRSGKKLMAAITCTHVMFKLTDYKMPYDSYIKEAYGVHISTLLDKISAATGGKFTFKVHDTFDLSDVKDWGDGNALKALNDVIKLYNCEVDPDNFVIHLRKKIGTNSGLQYRIRKNIITANFKDDTNSLVTRLFATMKDDRTWIGQPASILTNEERARLSVIPGAIVDGIIKVNYLISPYQAFWASDSINFFDGEYVEQDIEDPIKLLEASRKKLEELEVPKLEVSISAADLFKLDKTEPQPHLGDTVTCIDPDLGLDAVKVRITDLTEYPYNMDKHSQVTVANVMMRDFEDIIADLEKSKGVVNNIFSGGLIRTEMFETFAKQAITDITNSKTELIYPPEGGILAQEKSNPLEQVRLTSRGLGISTDGWKSVRSAITARGVLAETVIGQFGNFVSMLIGSGEDVVHVNTKGIAAGRADFNSAPFRVDMKGHVVARDIELTGQIVNSVMATSRIDATEINGGSINGSIITGGLIRTAAYGARVESDYRGWRSYDSNNIERISVNINNQHGMSALNFASSSGEAVGFLNGGDSLLQLLSVKDIHLAAVGRRIFFQGDVDFSNVNRIIGLSSSNISDFAEKLSGKVDRETPTSSVTAGAHNHGIPDGTQFKDVNGRVYTWSSYGGFTHSHTV